jgi:hypothetical protein
MRGYPDVGMDVVELLVDSGLIFIASTIDHLKDSRMAETRPLELLNRVPSGSHHAIDGWIKITICTLHCGY